MSAERIEAERREAVSGVATEETPRRRVARGLPWIAVAVDHLRHPKMVELGHRLGDPRAPLHAVAVWCYFAEHFPEGTMPNRPALVAALEAAGLWQGEAGVLVAAMVEVGLLERRRGRLCVHDWDEYQGAHVSARVRDRMRKRLERAAAREAKRKEKSPSDVPRMSDLPSPSPSTSPSPSPSRSSAPPSATPRRDGREQETIGNGTEAVLLAALPGPAAAVAARVGRPLRAVEADLDELRGRGRVRYVGQTWELNPPWP